MGPIHERVFVRRPCSIRGPIKKPAKAFTTEWLCIEGKGRGLVAPRRMRSRKAQQIKATV